MEQQVVDSNTVVIPEKIDQSTTVETESTDTAKTVSGSNIEQIDTAREQVQANRRSEPPRVVPINSRPEQHNKNFDVQLVEPAEVLFHIPSDKKEFVSNTVELELPMPLKRTKSNTPWEIPIMLICILLIGLVKTFNKRRLTIFSNSIFNIRAVPQYLREENAFSNQLIAGLTLCFVLIFSMLILHVTRLWYPLMAIKPFQLYTKACLFIILVYICKFAILELLSEILDKSQIFKEYIFNVLLFNSLAAICILPILLANSLLFEYKLQFIISAIVIMTLIYMYRNYRAVQISISYKYPVYYIFLYLCTLEILPGIVVIKLLKEQLI